MPSGYIRGTPDVSWWMTQIRGGIDFRKKYAHEERWPLWREYYRGNWMAGTIPANLFFRMTRTIVPRIYFRNPSISVQATQPGFMFMAFAKLLESIDNKLMRQMRIKEQMKRMVHESWFFGTAIGKLGFGAQHVPTPLVGGVTGRPIKNNEVFEYDSRIIRQMPWFLRVHPGNFIVPSGTVELRQARWAAEWIRRPLMDVKEDPTLKNTAHLTGVQSLGKKGTEVHGRTDIKTFEEMIDLVEVRDKKTGRVFVIAPFATDRLLFDEPDEMQVEQGINYFDLVFNPDDEVFWGVPDSKILEPQQLELNEIRTQQMKHRRLSLVRILAKQNGISEEEAAKMVSEFVAPVVWTKDDPNTTVKIVEGADIPDGLIKAEQIVMQDVREQSGFGRNQFGEYSEGKSKRTTAHEAEIVRLASEIRVDERRDTTADMLTDLIEHLHPIIFKFWRQEDVIDVAGPGGIPLWVQFRPEVLKLGSYEVRVDPDSSLPETKELRQQRAAQVYQLLKTNPLIDPLKLTQYFLNELEGVQFSRMLRGLPAGAGSQQRPLSLDQFVRVLSNAAEAGIPNLPQGALEAPQAGSQGGES